MEAISELMATYEAELRSVADEFGGQVDVWRPEPAQVIALPSPAAVPAGDESADEFSDTIAQIQAALSEDEDDFDLVIDDADFEEIEDEPINDDETNA